MLKKLGFKAENANALRLPGCFRGTSCAKPGHSSYWSWCRQRVAFTLENSAAESVFHRRKLQSLSYHATEISALSYLFQFSNHNFSLQARSSEMSGCATLPSLPTQYTFTLLLSPRGCFSRLSPRQLHILGI